MPRNRDTSAATAANTRRKHQRWAAEMREAGYPLERELLRTIRRQIGDIDASVGTAWSVQAAALTILFNHEHAAIGKTGENPKITKSLPCRWCRATTGHNVGCHAYGE